LVVQTLVVINTIEGRDIEISFGDLALDLSVRGNMVQMVPAVSVAQDDERAVFQKVEFVVDF
jgi:hypothetical protein